MCLKGLNTFLPWPSLAQNFLYNVIRNEEIHYFLLVLHTLSHFTHHRGYEKPIKVYLHNCGIKILFNNLVRFAIFS